MPKAKILYQLDFPKVSTAYEDTEKRSVCAGCGSYYVVTPEELKGIKATVKEMYEALKKIALCKSVVSGDIVDIAQKALAKAEGKEQRAEIAGEKEERN